MDYSSNMLYGSLQMADMNTQASRYSQLYPEYAATYFRASVSDYSLAYLYHSQLQGKDEDLQRSRAQVRQLQMLIQQNELEQQIQIKKIQSQCDMQLSNGLQTQRLLKQQINQVKEELQNSQLREKKQNYENDNLKYQVQFYKQKVADVNQTLQSVQLENKKLKSSQGRLGSQNEKQLQQLQLQVSSLEEANRLAASQQAQYEQRVKEYDAEKDELQQTVEKFKMEILKEQSDFEIRTDKYEAYIRELRTHLDDANQINLRYSQYQKEYQNKAKYAEDEAARLKQQLTEYTESEKKITEQQKQIDDAQALIQEFQEQVAQYYQSEREKLDYIEKLQEENQSLQTDTYQTQDDQQEYISDMYNYLDYKQLEISALNDKFTKVVQKILKDAKAYVGQDVSAGSQNEATDTLNATVSYLIYTIKNKDDEIEALGYELDYSRKESMMTTSTGETMTLREQVAKKSHQLYNVNDYLYNLRDERRKMGEYLDSYKYQVTTLSEKLQRQQDSYQNLSDNMSMMLANMRDNGQQYILENKYKDQIINQQKCTISSLNSQVKKLKSDISELSKQIKVLIESNKATEQQLQEQTQRLINSYLSEDTHALDDKYYQIDQLTSHLNQTQKESMQTIKMLREALVLKETELQQKIQRNEYEMSISQMQEAQKLQLYATQYDAAINSLYQYIQEMVKVNEAQEQQLEAKYAMITSLKQYLVDNDAQFQKDKTVLELQLEDTKTQLANLQKQLTTAEPDESSDEELEELYRTVDKIMEPESDQNYQ